MREWSRADLTVPPSCMGDAIEKNTDQWRIIRNLPFFNIEVRSTGGRWEGGLSGTAEWLGLTELEQAEAFEGR